MSNADPQNSSTQIAPATLHQANTLCQNLSVETTDYCNQKCHYCNQTNKINSMHGAGRRNEFMDMKLFKTIVDRMSAMRPPFRSFTPYWSGEPLLHPETAEMFRYLFKRNQQKRFFESFLMNTNAVYLTEEIAKVLLDYAAFLESKNPDAGMHITLSLDSVDPATYALIRRVPERQLEVVLENIDRFLTLRSKRGLRKPALTYQTVVCEENVEELGETLAYWREKLARLGIPYEVISEVTYFNDRDAIFFRQLDDGRYVEAVRAKQLHQRAIKQLGIGGAQTKGTADVMFATSETVPEQSDWLKRKKPCFQLWNMMVTSKDGTVVPCCKDLFFELKLGNIKTQSFDAMWHGERLRQMRLDQIEGKFESYAVCSHCIHPPGGELSVHEVIDYLGDVGRMDLLEPYLARIFGSEGVLSEAKPAGTPG